MGLQQPGHAIPGFHPQRPFPPAQFAQRERSDLFDAGQSGYFVDVAPGPGFACAWLGFWLWKKSSHASLTAAIIAFI